MAKIKRKAVRSDAPTLKGRRLTPKEMVTEARKAVTAIKAARKRAGEKQTGPLKANERNAFRSKTFRNIMNRILTGKGVPKADTRPGRTGGVPAKGVAAVKAGTVTVRGKKAQVYRNKGSQSKYRITATGNRVYV